MLISYKINQMRQYQSLLIAKCDFQGFVSYG